MQRNDYQAAIRHDESRRTLGALIEDVPHHMAQGDVKALANAAEVADAYLRRHVAPEIRETTATAEIYRLARRLRREAREGIAALTVRRQERERRRRLGRPAPAGYFARSLVR